MDRPWLSAAVAVLLPLSGVAAEPGYLRLKRVEIVDRHGFEKPMPAMSLLVPTEWSFDGEVRFAQRVGNPEDLVRLAFRTTSPDGRLAIEMFPGWGWAMNPATGQMVQSEMYQSSAEYPSGCAPRPVSCLRTRSCSAPCSRPCGWTPPGRRACPRSRRT